MIAAAVVAQAPTQEAPVRQARPDAVQDKPIARVGDVRILPRDLLAEVNRQIPLNYYHSKVPPERMAEFRRAALDRLIEKTLIHLDAKRRGLTATEDDIAERFADTLKKAGPRFTELSDESKAKLLEQNRPLVVRRILIDKNEARFSSSVPEVTDRQVRASYDQIADTLTAPAEAHLRHILVKVSPSASDSEIRAARDRIDRARKEIVGGKDFGAVAREYSSDIYAERGGDLGVVKQGSFLHGPVDERAFKLADGELSEVFSSIYGFHLLRCEKRLPRRKLTFEEVEKKVRARLKAAAVARARGAWLAELRRDHPVKVFAGELVAPPAPPAPTSRPSKR